MAEGFYKKLGFSHLNPNDKTQNTVINFIAEDVSDYPKYLSFMTKPLQLNKQRWYIDAAEKIKTITNEFEKNI